MFFALDWLMPKLSLGTDSRLTSVFFGTLTRSASFDIIDHTTYLSLVWHPRSASRDIGPDSLHP